MNTFRWPILVVDDNEMSQRLTIHQLRKIGFVDVATASDGKAALAWLNTNTCSIILADCKMPEMDGYEMTRRIREFEKRRGGRIPIIAVTAAAMDNERKKCLASGMDAHLAKPVQIEMLKSALSPWITSTI